MALFGRPVSPVLAVLSPDQAEACAILHRSAFAQGWSAIEFERLIGARESFGDAAVLGRTGALAGFILSRGAAGEAEVLTIAVAAAWRRKGIGRRLLERHLGRLAAARVGALFLEVSEGNVAARRLYAATGFVEVGRRKGYYPGEAGPTAALVLRRGIV